MTAGTEQVFKSLTDRGASGCKEFSMSLHNSQNLAAELFQQTRGRKSTPLTPANRSEQHTLFAFLHSRNAYGHNLPPASKPCTASKHPGSVQQQRHKTKAPQTLSSHGTLSELPSPKGLLTDTLTCDFSPFVARSQAFMGAS